MSKTHQTIKTVSPVERALLVTVSESNLASVGGVLPPEDTLYSSALFKALIGKDYMKEFSGFKYKEQFDNVKGLPGEDSQRGTLLFVRTKTPAERNTPFETEVVTQEIQWPAVLEWIQFGQETGFPLSQNYINGQGVSSLVIAPRWLVKRGYRPALSLETTIRIRKFLSDVPWPDWALVSDEPQPTEVSWDLVGSHGNMGKCLHPDVRVPTSSNGYRVLSEAGDSSSSSSTYRGGQFFPRTNHLGWRDYVVNRVEKVQGQYLRTEWTYESPTRPRITEEQS